MQYSNWPWDRGGGLRVVHVESNIVCCAPVDLLGMVRTPVRHIEIARVFCCYCCWTRQSRSLASLTCTDPRSPLHRSDIHREYHRPRFCLAITEMQCFSLTRKLNILFAKVVDKGEEHSSLELQHSSCVCP